MNNQTKWTSVYKTISKVEAEIVKGNIENEGIPCVVVNKQDSSYLMILPGMVELHVPEDQKELALAIIAQQTTEDEENEA
ncbi:MAG: DUF2007 domain-containing protein [Chitinophagaceae bacterium]|nr:DUF2007 domain-containing protein [Chitinophagaceae bacterium]